MCSKSKTQNCPEPLKKNAKFLNILPLSINLYLFFFSSLYLSFFLSLYLPLSIPLSQLSREKSYFIRKDVMSFLHMLPQSLSLHIYLSFSSVFSLSSLSFFYLSLSFSLLLNFSSLLLFFSLPLSVLFFISSKSLCSFLLISYSLSLSLSLSMFVSSYNLPI